MLSFVEILTNLAHDTGVDRITLDYCLSRLSAEGFSFLSVTLPSFSKHVIRCIEVGYFNHPSHPETLWSSFKLQRWGRIPLIFKVQLRGLFSISGVLSDSPDPAALATLRQFCEYFYKLSTEFSDEQLASACKKYKATESSIGDTVDWSFVQRVRRFVLRNYISDIPDYDTIIKQNRPRDTPGAFAGSTILSGISPTEFRKTLVGTRLLPNVRHANLGGISPSPNSKAFRWSKAMPIRHECANTCEVIFVPKDSRGPRVISKEPLARLRYQMSFFDFMVGQLEKASNYRINFRDQSVNRRLAQVGSIDASWSTMDLKDASDRVPVTVARAIFRHTPLSKFLDFRSTFARLPDGEILAINKLSGMGSGLTFPTMALIIHASISTEIARYMSEKKACSLCYVYGDDVIVPTKYAHLVEPALKKVGLMLNKEKCFSSGPFRESCGGDYLNGVPVSPVRARFSNLRLPTSKELTRNGSLPSTGISDMACVQYVKHANELQLNGMDALAELYYRACERNLHIGLPRVMHGSGVLGRLGTYIEVLSCSENIPDPVLVPDSVSYARAESRRGILRHDTISRLYSTLRSMELDRVDPPSSGISLPRKGSIFLRPGSRERRLASAVPSIIRERDLTSLRYATSFGANIRSQQPDMPASFWTWAE